MIESNVRLHYRLIMEPYARIGIHCLPRISLYWIFWSEKRNMQGLSLSWKDRNSCEVSACQLYANQNITHMLVVMLGFFLENCDFFSKAAALLVITQYNY